MNTIETKLAGIQARADAATEGPWEFGGAPLRYQDYPERGHSAVVSPSLGEESDEEYNHAGMICSDIPYYPHPVTKPNQKFIAHARTDIPALVKALRRAMETIDDVSKCAPEFCDPCLTDIAAILSE